MWPRGQTDRDRRRRIGRPMSRPYRPRCRDAPGRRSPSTLDLIARPPTHQVVPAVVVAPLPPRPSRWGRLEIGGQPAGVDHATWRRLRNGRRGGGAGPSICTATPHSAAIHASSNHFLRSGPGRAASACVEVITGRGSGERRRRAPARTARCGSIFPIMQAAGAGGNAPARRQCRCDPPAAAASPGS